MKNVISTVKFTEPVFTSIIGRRYDLVPSTLTRRRELLIQFISKICEFRSVTWMAYIIKYIQYPLWHGRTAWSNRRHPFHFFCPTNLMHTYSDQSFHTMFDFETSSSTTPSVDRARICSLLSLSFHARLTCRIRNELFFGQKTKKMYPQSIWSVFFVFYFLGIARGLQSHFRKSVSFRKIKTTCMHVVRTDCVWDWKYTQGRQFCFREQLLKMRKTSLSRWLATVARQIAASGEEDCVIFIYESME